VDTVRAKSAADLQQVERLILPGVGAFDHAMELLDASGMRGPLERLVLREKVPVLGICVGMQILAEASDEGVTAGLGWVAGRVRSFGSNAAAVNLPMPHMGWNDVVPGSGAGCAVLFFAFLLF
jgi:glutamine amidotransferase